MNKLYAGTGKRTEGAWKELASVNPDLVRKPEGYIASEEVIAAVNVALALGQPLLLTGEPGTGKTQLAYAVAHELGLDAPLKFETKSTTESRDLFYTFDTIGRFHALSSEQGGPGQLGREAELSASNPLRFINYNALGLAIIRANPIEALQGYVPPGYENAEPRRSLVLIDEIDKAPRDVPNDILSEIETMSFRVPEIDVTHVLRSDPKWRPVVIITSNSEKALPDAFLRRCVYYHMPFPSSETLNDIVASRIGQRYSSDPVVAKALSLFGFVRDPALNLRKRPATAELLDWLTYLVRFTSTEDADKRDKQFEAGFRSALLKTEDDQQRMQELLAAWRKQRQSA